MDDISNIRVTEINNSFLERLVTEEKLFINDKTAAVFAVSFAINNNFDSVITDDYSLSSPTINKWDAASVDSTGAIRLILKIRHPKIECPFRALQAIMDIGLNKMRELCPETGFIKISHFIKKEDIVDGNKT